MKLWRKTDLCKMQSTFYKCRKQINSLFTLMNSVLMTLRQYLLSDSRFCICANNLMRWIYCLHIATLTTSIYSPCLFNALKQIKRIKCTSTMNLNFKNNHIEIHSGDANFVLNPESIVIDDYVMDFPGEFERRGVFVEIRESGKISSMSSQLNENTYLSSRRDISWESRITPVISITRIWWSSQQVNHSGKLSKHGKHLWLCHLAQRLQIFSQNSGKQ